MTQSKYTWTDAKERKLRALYRKVHRRTATRNEALASRHLSREKELALRQQAEA